LQVTIREEPPVALVSIVGSVDSLQTAMAGAVQNGQTRLVADFSRADYTSSAGLRVILATVKELRQKGGESRIAGVRPNVRKAPTTAIRASGSQADQARCTNNADA
jgi:anti-sigma B factor antagonist